MHERKPRRIPQYSSSIEEHLPRFVDKPEEATALNCSACGAPALRGAPMCLHCGSGLNSEIVFNIEKLKATADELDWKEDCAHAELPGLLDLMRAIGQNRKKDVFITMKGIPLVVRMTDTDNKKILKELKVLKTLKARDELGDSWYQALQRFHDLQKTLSALDPGLRKEIGKKFSKRKEFGMYLEEVGLFFTNVDFKNAEEIMGNYLGDDDDSLNRFIDLVEEEIRSFKV